MIVNADGQVLGRLATFVAKKALLGEPMVVVNAEKALLSGRKEIVLARELEKLRIQNLGNPIRGPFHQRRPDRYVRRAIRGMLPRERTRGREAFERVQVYIGVPEERIKDDFKLEKIQVTDLEGAKKNLGNYTTVGEVCKFIGGKW